MKSSPLQSTPQKSHLKVIKNSKKNLKKVSKRLYINTLIPGFSFTNNKGETVTPEKCVLL